MVSLVLAQAGNVEVFSDRDETYVRAGATQGLQVGQSLNVTSKDGKAVGSAVTLEVWDALARVHLDESAQKFHGAKRVLLGKAEPVEAEQESAAPQAAAAAQLKDDDDAAESEEEDDNKPVAPGELRGHASAVGFWQGKRITIENASKTDWHHCKLRLPDRRRYELGDLAHHDSEHVMLFRFEGGDGLFSSSDKPLDSIQVKCDEGMTKLKLAL
ncbi:MAG: hypothetical protein QM723_29810 [Myxococcaceae bacterium]